MIQIDGIKRNVYMKLVDSECLHALLRETEGQAVYKYRTGKLLHVTIQLANLGSKRIRVVNLTPEVANDTLRATLAPYGKIMDIQNEKWSRAYKYIVDNSVSQVTMSLHRHFPSHLTVTGQRILLSYEGQPATCYGCGEEGHMYQGCPARYQQRTVRDVATKQTYASKVKATAAVTPEQT
jgi:hypothetical protein